MPPAFQIQQEPGGKRESGASPERSGHCNQGAFLWDPLYSGLYEKEKETRRSASQETCLISRRDFRRKLNSCLKSNFLFGHVCFPLKQAYFVLWDAQSCGTVQNSRTEPCLRKAGPDRLWRHSVCYILQKWSPQSNACHLVQCSVSFFSCPG